MSGRLAVVGLGPGDARWLTREAEAALAAAEALYGYGPYLDRVPARPGQTRHPSDNREEGARAAAALRHAADGAQVAIVSGGDPGVFAMAAAVCEEIEAGPQAWRALDLAIVPGVTAMLAVAARVGAPLGHDFCALSLSDNLEAVGADRAPARRGGRRRLRDRALQPGLARAALAARRAPSIACANGCRPRPPVIFGRAVGRPDESVVVTTLRARRSGDRRHGDAASSSARRRHA